MSRLVLCADDYALSEGVTAAILDLLRRGRITATGAMTNRPNWPDAARRLKDFAGVADLGVHLNLTCGASLGAMPHLAPGGELPKLGDWLRRMARGAIAVAEVEDEFCRQIDAFGDALGREPDFLDGHQHVHALPRLREALLGAVRRLGLQGRVYVRDPGDRLRAILARRVATDKALVIAVLARGFGARLRAAGIAKNDGFSGVSAFDPARDFGRDVAAFLRELGPAHLVMCHPGFIDAELQAVDPVNATRPQEHAFLAGEGFAELLAKIGARLVRFNDLAGP